MQTERRPPSLHTSTPIPEVLTVHTTWRRLHIIHTSAVYLGPTRVGRVLSGSVFQSVLGVRGECCRVGALEFLCCVKAEVENKRASMCVAVVACLSAFAVRRRGDAKACELISVRSKVRVPLLWLQSHGHLPRRFVVRKGLDSVVRQGLHGLGHTDLQLRCETGTELGFILPVPLRQGLNCDTYFPFL